MVSRMRRAGMHACCEDIVVVVVVACMSTCVKTKHSGERRLHS